MSDREKEVVSYWVALSGVLALIEKSVLLSNWTLFLLGGRKVCRPCLG